VKHYRGSIIFQFKPIYSMTHSGHAFVRGLHPLVPPWRQRKLNVVTKVTEGVPSGKIYSVAQ